MICDELHFPENDILIASAILLFHIDEYGNINNELELWIRNTEC